MNEEFVSAGEHLRRLAKAGGKGGAVHISAGTSHGLDPVLDVGGRLQKQSSSNQWNIKYR